MKESRNPDPVEGKCRGIPRKRTSKGYSDGRAPGYQRALISLRKEFCRSKTLNSVNNLRNPLSGRKNDASGWIGKAAGVVGVAGKTAQQDEYN